MKQGTISVLFGCHSIIHSVLVMLAWRKLYHAWPKPWQVVCIILHDIGHWGKDYLDHPEKKKEHWELGAYVASWFFGLKAYYLTAGHCSHSGYHKSPMYHADKYSYYIAPTWWLYINSIVEPKLNRGKPIMVAIREFQKQVKESIDSGEYRESHAMYLERSS